MNSIKSPKIDFKFLDDAKAVLTPTISSVIIFIIVALETIFDRSSPTESIPVFSISVLGGTYVISQMLFILRNQKRNEAVYAWSNAIVAGIGLGIFGVTVKSELFFFFFLLQVLATTSLSILYKRGPAYLLIALSSVIHMTGYWWKTTRYPDWLQIVSLVTPIAIVEIVFQLKAISLNHLKRLETINKFIQHINTTLLTEDLMVSLNLAMQNALDADTYFIGLVNGDHIQLPLFYDDGEYFENVSLSMEGSLAGWVVKNQQPLFLHDMTNDVALEGVKTVIVGKERSSLSWMGVPMKSTHINGVLALASYRVNAFNQADLGLLSNLAQHTVLALDNAFHHNQVQEQARLDSLTGTYNHRYFLELLKRNLSEEKNQEETLSLLMIDVDYFKQYNDTYGHQIGDMVLTLLCDTIRSHIKITDLIGRWGGEEFAIALPNANGENAHHVALRIQDSLSKLKLSNSKHAAIPCPTLSQGIAVFPDEAVEMDKLIYIADQRLYIAKERGRNQIEPALSHWKKIKSAKRSSR